MAESDGFAKCPRCGVTVYEPHHRFCRLPVGDAVIQLSLQSLADRWTVGPSRRHGCSFALHFGSTTMIDSEGRRGLDRIAMLLGELPVILNQLLEAAPPARLETHSRNRRRSRQPAEDDDQDEDPEDDPDEVLVDHDDDDPETDVS